MKLPTRASEPAQRVGLLLTILVAAGVAAWWVVSAARVANEGFDVTDEGYYLLSYRWWDEIPLALTGAQYLYGPVFELLGYDVVGLRIFRLVTVAIVHLGFGYCFMRWLRGRRPDAPRTPLWELAGIAAIVAAGGMCYSWLPMSPGYNDVILLGSLTLASCLLWMSTAVDRGRKVPFWAPLLFGMVAAAMLLAKWSSVVVIGLVVVAAVVVLAEQGWKAVFRDIGLGLAGLAVAVLLVELFVVRLTVAVPGIMAVNRFIAETSYSPTALLWGYASSGAGLFMKAVSQHWLLLVAAAIAVVGRWRWLRWAAAALAAGALVLSVWRAIADGDVVGGSQHKSDYTATLLAAVLVALVTAVAALIAGRYGLTPRSALSRERTSGWVVLGLLTVLPLVHGFGTNNPLYTLGFNMFAAFVAVMIAVLTGITAVPVVARATVGLVTVASLIAVASISFTAMFLHPYRSVGHAKLTEPSSLAPLDGVFIAPAAERQLSSLEARLRPHLKPGRHILGLDKMAGIVFVLQGKPLGEAWIAPKEQRRTAAGIEEACRQGEPWPAGQRPIILLNREISDLDTTALAACSIDFPADYRRLAQPSEDDDVDVYVPRDERPDGAR